MQDKRDTLLKGIPKHLKGSMINLSTVEAVQISRKWTRLMAQSFTREDQLGVSLLTMEQLKTEEKFQEKVQQG